VISAVDTNILIEYRQAGSPRAAHVGHLLAAASDRGQLIVCEIVYVELSAAYPSRAQLDEFLSDLDIALWRTGATALAAAGQSWKAYSRRRPSGLECPSCGSQQLVDCRDCGRPFGPPQHVAADFMVGAHAVAYADRLLSRDRAVYKKYFPALNVIY
jgi:predicted nucleic acid-binding protein